MFVCGHHCFLALSLLADFLLPCTVLTPNASIHSFIGQLFSAALVQHLPLGSVIQTPACGLPSSKFQLVIGLSVCSPSPSLNWGLFIVTSVGWWFLEPGGTDTRWLSTHVYTHLPIDSQTFWRTGFGILIVMLKKLWKSQRTSQRIASSFFGSFMWTIDSLRFLKNNWNWWFFDFETFWNNQNQWVFKKSRNPPIPNCNLWPSNLKGVPRE